MKKSILILLAILICASPAFAEETYDRGQDFQRRGEGMLGRGQGMGMGKGMGMMQKDTVVATSDGGVVIMQGPRLLKYDANLTLVKEVELPRGKKPGQDQGQQGQNVYEEGTRPPTTDDMPIQGEVPPPAN